VRLFLGTVAGSLASSKILRNSLFKDAICSLMATARLSWLLVKLYISMQLVDM
jgi:hypothetical protein